MRVGASPTHSLRNGIFAPFLIDRFCTGGVASRVPRKQKEMKGKVRKMKAPGIRCGKEVGGGTLSVFLLRIWYSICIIIANQV